MRGILFSQMEPPPAWDEEFHAWYETDHIPVRLALDGFEAATRYRALNGGPAYLAVYELSTMDVLATPEYQKIKSDPSAETTRMLANVNGFTRYTCVELADSGPSDRIGNFLSVVAFAVPDAELEEFDDWYATEHSARLLQADDWLRIRRYGVISGEGGPWNRLALHELADLSVMESAQRAFARQGPKRDALAEREWFGGSGRWLYEVISRA
jgi:hypothetical protein